MNLSRALIFQNFKFHLVECAESTIMCYKGTVWVSADKKIGDLVEESCESGVTQCLITSGGVSSGKKGGESFESIQQYT